MDKTLQTTAWNCLPKGFKEEVKSRYRNALRFNEYAHECVVFRNLFGEHNLTPDAEGEEMLTVPRKKVEEKWQRAYEQEVKYSKAEQNPTTREELYYNRGILSVIDILFGSKCLPDNVATSEPNVDSSVGSVESLEPKPAEPKYHAGQKVKYKGKSFGIEITGVGKWDDHDGYRYKLDGLNHFYRESDLEPYTEPKDEVAKMKPIESKVSVYLATQEEDKEFRQLLHENGFKWNGGGILMDSPCWDSDFQASKIHFVYPDMTVTYGGNKTPDTLSFSEFKKRYFGEDVNLSQEIANCDKRFDNILKDSFREHNRLHIAAMAMQGILANPNPQMVNMDVHKVADLAILMSDALIAESEEGGDDGED